MSLRIKWEWIYRRRRKKIQNNQTNWSSECDNNRSACGESKIQQLMRPVTTIAVVLSDEDKVFGS